MLHVLYVHWSSIMPRPRRLLVKNMNVFSYCKKTNCIYKKSCKTKSWPSNQRRWKVFQFCIIFSLFCKSSPRPQKQNSKSMASCRLSLKLESKSRILVLEFWYSPYKRWIYYYLYFIKFKFNMRFKNIHFGSWPEVSRYIPSIIARGSLCAEINTNI